MAESPAATKPGKGPGCAPSPGNARLPSNGPNVNPNPNAMPIRAMPLDRFSSVVQSAM
jgi:hypothetical protein